MSNPPSDPDLAILDLRTGYRLASEIYDQWHWQEFWRRNELPIVRHWLALLDAGNVLDAGAGTGLYRAVIESSGHRAIGLDISKEMLLVQRRTHPEAIQVQGSLDALPFRDSSFDYVLSTRVLTHVPALLLVFREFARTVRPGGQLLLADLHPEHPYSKMSIKANRRQISIEIRKYSIEELKGSIGAAGLHLVEFRSYGLKDIAWKPPHEGFKNVYRDPTRPIFYTAQLVRP